MRNPKRRRVIPRRRFFLTQLHGYGIVLGAHGEPGDMAMEAGTNVVFSGYMGAGKSEVAERVAQRLAYELAEMDEIIAARACCSIDDMIKRDGEASFRDIESKLLRELLSYKGIVISTGGGALVNNLFGDFNCDLARERSIVVWLQVEFEVAAERVKNDPKKVKRPFFDEDALSRFRARQPLYKRAAHITVDANRPLDDVVADTLRQLEEF